jgi:hypothetical protein
MRWTLWSIGAVPIVLLVLALGAIGLHAQQTGGDSSEVVTKIRVEVIGFGGRVDLVLGDFDNVEDADVCERRWSKAHPDDLRLTRQREIQVRITRPRPPAPKPPQADPIPSVPRPGGGKMALVVLPNTSWSGGETLQGYGKLAFRFGPGETVSMIDADGTSTGRYSRSGSTVTLRFYDGTVVYTGTIAGEIIYGSGRNSRQSWTFSVKLQ